jgi:hypothetical protein
MLWRHHYLPTEDLMKRIEILQPELIIIGREKTFVPAVVQWTLDVDERAKKSRENCYVLASSHILQVRMLL